MCAVLACCSHTALCAPGPGLSPVPANGGVLPNGELSDKVAWTRFIQAVTPVNKTQVVFETWASDPEIYSDHPHWPSLDEAREKKLRASVLQRSLTPHSLPTSQFDDPCGAPRSAAAGNFPVPGIVPPPGPIALTAPQPCFGEEVRRNRPSFDYLVNNGLTNKAGLAQAWLRATTSKWKVSLPNDAVEIKADWVPLETLVDWLHANHVHTTVPQLKRQYYTTVSGGLTYGLVSLHLSSKEIPNWVWASFEHHANPGRCDTMGCTDNFGALKHSVAPGSDNQQYGNCLKSPALAALFQKSHLDGVWNNYCLKATQIDYLSKKGKPIMAGDSFTERIAAGVPIKQSSCISCHAAAAVNRSGVASTVLLSTMPVGTVTLPKDQVAMDFIWGILHAQ